MRCRMLRWMPVCAILSLPTMCQHAPVPVDSFCQVYQPVVQQKGDGASVTAAAPGPKRRILANELTYRDQCRAGT